MQGCNIGSFDPPWPNNDPAWFFCAVCEIFQLILEHRCILCFVKARGSQPRVRAWTRRFKILPNEVILSRNHLKWKIYSWAVIFYCVRQLWSARSEPLFILCARWVLAACSSINSSHQPASYWAAFTTQRTGSITEKRAATHRRLNDSNNNGLSLMP